MATLLRATSYQLDQVVLRSPRLEDSEGVDISNITAEINLYENLDLPYVAGDITIADSANLTSLIQFNGQERVTIRLSVDDENPLEREFIVYALRYQGKATNDAASVLVLAIIEEHAFISYFKRLSWRYQGNIRDIVKKVFISDLEIPEGDRRLTNYIGQEAPFQDLKFVVPNWTPLQFIDTVTRRATTRRGEPFFCFSSLRDGIMFRSLSELLTSPPTNTNEPYKYSQVASSVELKEEKRVILRAEFPETDNSIKLGRQGALGMQFFNVDPFDPGKNQSAKFNIVDHFGRKKEARTTLNAYTPYDEEFGIGPSDKKLHELDSQYFSQVCTSKMFEVGKGFDEEDKIADHLHKAARLSDMSILEKERYTITIPGQTMLNASDNQSIGKIVSVIMTSNLPAVANTPSEEIVDEKRGAVGALFLVTKCHHSFRVNNQYYAALEISRTDRNKSLT